MVLSDCRRLLASQVLKKTSSFALRGFELDNVLMANVLSSRFDLRSLQFWTLLWTARSYHALISRQNGTSHTFVLVTNSPVTMSYYSTIALIDWRGWSHCHTAVTIGVDWILRRARKGNMTPFRAPLHVIQNKTLSLSSLWSGMHSYHVWRCVWASSSTALHDNSLAWLNLIYICLFEYLH